MLQIPEPFPDEGCLSPLGASSHRSCVSLLPLSVSLRVASGLWLSAASQRMVVCKLLSKGSGKLLVLDS